MGASSGIFNGPALHQIAMFFAGCRCRRGDQEVGRVGGPPEKNADRRIHYKPFARVPETRARTVGLPFKFSTARAERKGLCSFLVFGTISQLEARNQSFVLASAFRHSPSNGGEHHTDDMARRDSARGHDARFPIAPLLWRPRYEYGDLPQSAEYLCHQ